MSGESDDDEWPALPHPAAWDRLGLSNVADMPGGHQSRVFAARLGRDGNPVAVKLTDGRRADIARLEARTEIVDTIASTSALVTGPLRIGGAFVHRLGTWHAVVTPLVDGPRPDVDRAGHVELMAHTLAELHRVMAAIPIGDVGPVAALEIGDAYQLPVQLLHGDFSAANIRLHDGQARVFDFDDCGSGPVQFDVANTLYMVMFDATVTGNPGRYERFREWFVDAYRSATGRSMDDALLDTMIELRCDALRFWIDHLDEAPTGIRTSSPDWIAVLRRFTHRAT